MVIKGKYKVKYILDRKLTELVVEVELKARDGLLKPGETIYYGVTTVNGSPYEVNLNGCVNAQYCAEGVALNLIEEYKEKAKMDGKSFRLKRK